MNFYIGDTHFGDRGIAKYQSPFSDTRTMNDTIISNWNRKVRDTDHVYIVGDFSVNANIDFGKFLKRLNGRLHLICGNHDFILLQKKGYLKYFESVDMIKYIKDRGENICLCHYPIAEWGGRMNDVKHVYAHIHKNSTDVFKFMHERGNSYCASAMINNYEPCTLEELAINNNAYMESFNLLNV